MAIGAKVLSQKIVSVMTTEVGSKVTLDAGNMLHYALFRREHALTDLVAIFGRGYSTGMAHRGVFGLPKELITIASYQEAVKALPALEYLSNDGLGAVIYEVYKRIFVLAYLCGYAGPVGEDIQQEQLGMVLTGLMAYTSDWGNSASWNDVLVEFKGWLCSVSKWIEESKSNTSRQVSAPSCQMTWRNLFPTC